MLHDAPQAPAARPTVLGAQDDPQHLTGDVERLRRQVDQQRLALKHLSEALLGLRRGTRALREENRELRLELEAARRQKRRPRRADRSADRAGPRRPDRGDTERNPVVTSASWESTS